jgi:hypothetical protein
MALAVLDLSKAIEFSQSDFAGGDYSEGELDLLQDLQARRTYLWPDQQAFVAACDRWDSLYYPPDEAVLPAKGASHWWYHSSASLPGKAHISINTPPLYVDIPAALQSVSPIENVIPPIDNEQSRALASMGERLYAAWRDEIGLNMLGHKACVVKGLYGRTAAKVWWDPDTGFPRVDVIDQPRNLWLGWGQSDYRTLDWAAYSYLMTPEAIFAQYGLVAVERRDEAGTSYPYLMPVAAFSSWTMARRAMWSGGSIEVIDYWYRQPKSTKTPKVTKLKPVTHDTWNAIVVGNRVAQNLKFTEYEGTIPYVPIFNSFIPGVPNGRPELFDIEQLIREKDERLTSGSQLMHNIVNAQYWQLTGAEAPDAVPVGLRPKPQQVVAPGAGNRIEKIEPWFPEFQLEQFLTRIDRELVDVSGLNDLLRGMAPASVMSSSKAINALVANYETRITMKRDLYYEWRRKVWYLARTVWANKADELAPVLLGSGRLDILAPSLTPRDDMETAQIARTLVDGKLWSAIRGMDRTGVDDPEAEQDTIRLEQTDVALNPAAVQVIAAVAQQLQAMGFQNAQQATESLAGGQPGGQGGPPPGSPEEQQALMEQMRGQMGAPQGQPGSGEQPVPANEAMPANVEGGAPGAGPVPGPGGPGQVMAQTMVKGGEATNRLLFQQPINQPGQPPAGG